MEALNTGAAEALQIVEEVFEEKPLVVEPTWLDPDNMDVRCANYREVIRRFVNGTLNGKIKVRDNHIYSTRKNGTELWMFKNNPSIRVHVCVAKKVNGSFIGNSSSMAFFRQPKSKKVVAMASVRLKIQTVMQEVLPMVPFQLFKETKLDIDSFQMIEKGPDEKLDLGRRIKDKKVLTHFTGAMVFKIGSKVFEDQYFLFDADRNDVKMKNLNLFLSRLPKPVATIAEAYASLKPTEVYEAERFLGHEVPRQGEWFFIPTNQDAKPLSEPQYHNRGRHPYQNATLQSKGNRPHYAERLSEEGFVKGRITHGGFEHKPIELDKWHKPVPNTAVESFSISGAVD